MPDSNEKGKIVTFPIKIDSVLNKKIDIAVVYTNAESKKEYILKAIERQVAEDLSQITQQTNN